MPLEASTVSGATEGVTVRPHGLEVASRTHSPTTCVTFEEKSCCSVLLSLSCHFQNFLNILCMAAHPVFSQTLFESGSLYNFPGLG